MSHADALMGIIGQRETPEAVRAAQVDAVSDWWMHADQADSPHLHGEAEAEA